MVGSAEEVAKRQWYLFDDNGGKTGPFAPEQLVAQPGVSRKSLVLPDKRGFFNDYLALGDVEELAALYERSGNLGGAPETSGAESSGSGVPAPAREGAPADADNSAASFVQSRNKPIYTYALGLTAMGAAALAFSVIAAVVVAFLGLMGSAEEGHVVFMFAVVIAGMIVLSGWLFKTLCDISAAALRVFADTAVGVAPLTDAEKLAILRATGG